MIITISENFEREEFIKKSRFICHLARVENEITAQEFITSIKKVHSKANHNCSAFTLGEQQEIQRASDDGEPSGTAGVPILEVLKKKQVTNICAVVTRYFGGIKLGAGGLIRAYAGSVNQALEEARLVRLSEQQEIRLTLVYNLFDRLEHFLSAQNLIIDSSNFMENISVSLYIDTDKTDDFLLALTEAFNGKITADKGRKRFVEVLI